MADTSLLSLRPTNPQNLPGTVAETCFHLTKICLIYNIKSGASIKANKLNTRISEIHYHFRPPPPTIQAPEKYWTLHECQTKPPDSPRFYLLSCVYYFFPGCLWKKKSLLFTVRIMNASQAYLERGIHHFMYFNILC